MQINCLNISDFLKTNNRADHTLGDSIDGVYLFADGNAPNEAGFNALLESTLFFPTPTYGLCMDFWYHMYGKDMGALNVFMNVSNTSLLLWSHAGDKGNQWLNGQISIKSSRSFRLSVEAVRGDGDLSNIAIDDIDFVERACMSDSLERKSNEDFSSTTTTTTQVAASTSPPKAESNLITKCDFEADFCIWNVTSTSIDSMSWTRAQGKLGQQQPGLSITTIHQDQEKKQKKSIIKTLLRKTFACFCC